MPHCAICQRDLPPEELLSGASLSSGLLEFIRATYPQISAQDHLCRDDARRYRSLYIRWLVEAGKGERDRLEQAVVTSAKGGEPLSVNLNESYEGKLTRGQRLADAIAKFGGSWTFILGFLGFLLAWVLLNSLVMVLRPFDPFPFILLNLILSCIAALQAPVIMMSQNRQEAKDRLRNENDYRTNLKAELEVRLLHEKFDNLLGKQWQRLLELQELQLELIEALSERGQPRDTPPDS